MDDGWDMDDIKSEFDDFWDQNDPFNFSMGELDREI